MPSYANVVSNSSTIYRIDSRLSSSTQVRIIEPYGMEPFMIHIDVENDESIDLTMKSEFYQNTKQY
jgi:hypothetical protein